jgi:hypothetical protein
LFYKIKINLNFDSVGGKKAKKINIKQKKQKIKAKN